MKKWLFSLLLLLLLILLLPQIASTPLGKPLFIQHIERETQAKVKVGSLKLSWFGPQRFNQIAWTRADVSGTIEELQIEAPFWSFKGPFLLKNGRAQYPGGEIENIQGKIEKNDFDLTGSATQGTLSVKGKVYSPERFHLDLDMKNFPAALLDPRLVPFSGPTLNLDGFITLEEGEGRTHLSLSSPSLQTQVRGDLKNRAFTLQDPLLISLHLTPELSAFLFPNEDSLFVTSLAANHPVSLRIQPKGFSFPLPFSLSELQIEKGELDLGKVECKIGAPLSSLLSLLETIEVSSWVETWFTPIPFSLQSNTLQLGRFDLLIAQSIHLCAWGPLNLANSQLDLTAGIPADTLQRSFGIRNILPSYVLTLPVHGTLQHPHIVKKPAAAKIAALLATNQIPKKGIFGNLVELFSRPKEEQDIPPPNRPFPWEKQ